MNPQNLFHYPKCFLFPELLKTVSQNYFLTSKNSKIQHPQQPKIFPRLVRDPLVTASFEGLVPPAMVMLLIYGISESNKKNTLLKVGFTDGSWGCGAERLIHGTFKSSTLNTLMVESMVMNGYLFGSLLVGVCL